MVVGLARWIADVFGKQLVLPHCISNENPAHICSQKPNTNEQAQKQVFANVTAIFERASLAGCDSDSHLAKAVEPVELSQLQQQQPHAARGITCLAVRVEDCANEIAMDTQLVSANVHLARFVQTDSIAYAIGWLNQEPNATSSALRRHMASVKYVKSPECRGSANCPATCRSPRQCIEARCPLHCMMSSQPLIATGDIFIAGLFQFAMQLKRPFEICTRPRLTGRAKSDVTEIAAALPEPRKFVCVHWRAGDFLVSSKATYNSHLSNTSLITEVIASAARAVGVSHALMLTNARRERQKEMRRMAKRAGVGLTIRACHSVPPDVEKEACVRGAAALVLTGGSTFSEHMLALAPPGTPYTHLGRCLRSLTPRDCYLGKSNRMSRRGSDRSRNWCRAGFAGDHEHDDANKVRCRVWLDYGHV